MTVSTKKTMREALLSKYSSRRNKLWLVGGYQSVGLYVEWKWQGEPFRSRLLFQFAPDEEFVRAKSYEEDIQPFLEWNNPQKPP